MHLYMYNVLTDFIGWNRCALRTSLILSRAISIKLVPNVHRELNREVNRILTISFWMVDRNDRK